MPEEQPVPEVQEQPNTPEAPASQETTSGESFTDSYNPNAVEDEAARAELDKAYKQMQSDYSRKTAEISQTVQEADEYKQFVAALQDPNYRDEALKALGVELPAAADPEFEDPTEKLSAELQEMREWKEQFEQSNQEAQYQSMEQDWMADQLETVEKRDGVEFDENEVKFLVAYSTSNRLADGAPDIASALQVMEDASKARQSRYVASKKAPRKPGSGVAGSPSVDLNNQKERQALMAEVAEAAASSE